MQCDGFKDIKYNQSSSSYEFLYSHCWYTPYGCVAIMPRLMSSSDISFISTRLLFFAYFTVRTDSTYSKSVEWNQNILEKYREIIICCELVNVIPTDRSPLLDWKSNWRHIGVKSSPCSRRLPVKTYINSFHRMALLHTKAHKGVTQKKRIVTRMTTQQKCWLINLFWTVDMKMRGSTKRIENWMK